MPLLTNSRAKAHRLCARFHDLTYVQGWRPRVAAPQLQFGSAFHLGMEHYWRDEPMPTTALLEDPFENARVNALLIGYEARWELEDDTRYETLAVEKEFNVPLVHPITGEEHAYWRLAGKMDLIVAEGDTIILGEHKTASEDISAGSVYWQRLDLDTQILTYQYAARELGYEVSRILYDVAAKPKQRPKKGETAGQFQARIMGEIAKDPNGYYRRGDLVRSQEQIDKAMLELWDYAERMKRDIDENWTAKNPDACFKYNRACSFWRVCSLGASLSDDGSFVQLADPNPELSNQQQEEAA